MRSVSVSRNLALWLVALGSAVACGGPAAPPKPPLAEGDGPFRLRYNRLPTMPGNPDLFFEVEGPGGWERISLENPDEEQDLLATLVALA